MRLYPEPKCAPGAGRERHDGEEALPGAAHPSTHPHPPPQTLLHPLLLLAQLGGTPPPPLMQELRSCKQSGRANGCATTGGNLSSSPPFPSCLGALTQVSTSQVSPELARRALGSSSDAAQDPPQGQGQPWGGGDGTGPPGKGGCNIREGVGR